MDNEQASTLLKKYNSGHCTEKEKELIERSFFEFNEQEIEISLTKLKNLKKQSLRELPKPKNRKNVLKVWVSVSAAAAAIVIALYLFIPKSHTNAMANLSMAEKILPIGNAAQIILSNGSTIYLDGKKGEVKINALSLTYKDGSEINFANSTGEQTISTPKGGEYKIVLSDGTKVWLNAATVLQYPTSFRETAGREVKLVSGEAYFEVAKDKKHPFTVTTADQTVTVLGTHFNVNAYERTIKTTLLEGSVRLYSLNKADSIKLKPGEQSFIKDNRFEKIGADLDMVTAWRNGKFKFKDADLQSILTEAERWYGIKVVYDSKISFAHLTGGISRKSSLATLLKLLQMSGVNFTLKEESGINILTIKS